MSRASDLHLKTKDPSYDTTAELAMDREDPTALILPGTRPKEPTTLLAVIANAASNPAVDVEKMRALLDMRREIEHDDAKRLFSEAMNEVQKAIQPIVADANNPQTSSQYASYHALDQALRPIYIAHGFEVSFDSEPSSKPDYVRVICTVSHIAGHSRQHNAHMPTDGKGPKGNAVMTATHAGGSALQYGKRYTLGMAFNISVSKDDDGNAGGTVAISEDEAKAFHKLVDDLGADEAKLLEFVHAETVEGMNAHQLKRATTAVNDWAKAQRRAKTNA